MPILLLTIGVNFISAQEANINRLEKEVRTLEEQIRTTRQEIDRQQKKLQKALKRVDVLKRAEADEESIKTAMALALSLSQKIDRLKAERDSLTDKSEDKKIVLRRFFTQKIDSLQQRLQANIPQTQKDKLQKETLRLYNKCLLYMPRFGTIHFDPQALLPPPQDSLGRILRDDYLSLSRVEIDSQLQVLESTESAIRKQQKLAAKAELFLDDVNEGLFFGPQDQFAGINVQSRKGNTDYTATDPGITESELNNRIITINRLYDDLVTSGQASSDSPLQQQKMERYLKLLNEVKEYLLLYRQFITEKLGQ